VSAVSAGTTPLTRLALLGLLGLLLGSQLAEGFASWALVGRDGSRAAAWAWCLSLPLLMLAALLLSWRLRRMLQGAMHLALLLPPLLLLGLLAGSLTQAGAIWAEARGDAGSGLQFRSVDEGRTLALRGQLAVGDSQRLQALLAAQPALVRLDLAFAGSSWAEARRMAGLIQSRKLATRAGGACDGSCTLVFLGGTPRQLLPGAELAFQRPTAPSLSPLWRHWMRGQQVAAYGALPADFIARAQLPTAPQFWRPLRTDLEAAGVIERPAYGLDVVLPPLGGALVAEYQAALRAQPTWLALERRFPGLLDEAAALLQARHGAGAGAAARAAQELVLERQQQLLLQASGETRQLYLGWMADALGALHEGGDSAACSALLAGDAAARRRLPAELAARELLWMEEASAETPQAPRPLKPLEREVIRRTLGHQPSQLLERLWTAGSRQSPLDCASARRLVAQLQELPGPQRRLALRKVFER